MWDTLALFASKNDNRKQHTPARIGGSRAYVLTPNSGSHFQTENVSDQDTSLTSDKFFLLQTVLQHLYTNGKRKGKAVPLQARKGPEGSKRFPDFMTTAQDDSGKVVIFKPRPPLPPGNAPGTHFFYRVSQPQGHSAIGRIMSVKNSNDTSCDRTSNLPICSTAP